MTTHFSDELFFSWKQMHLAASKRNELQWGEHYRKFNNLLVGAGESRVLDETINEILRVCSEEMEEEDIDDGGDDVLSVFHDDVISNLSVSFQPVKSKNSNIEKKVRRVEIFAIPMFGDHNSLTDIKNNKDFLSLLTNSGLMPTSSDISLFGAVPTEVAAEMILQPQKLHDILHATDSFFTEEDKTKQNEIKTNIANAWGVVEPNANTKEDEKLVVGGYLLIGAFSMTASVDSMIHQEGFGDIEDSDVEHFQELLEEWVLSHPETEKLQMGTIHWPGPIREAVALSLAELLFNSLTIQGSMGHDDDQLMSKVDIMIQNDDVHDDDMAYVYGYGATGELVGVSQTQAFSFGLLLTDIVEHWRNWMPLCDIRVVQKFGEQSLQEENKKKFH